VEIYQTKISGELEMTGFYYENKNSGNFLIYSPQREEELDAFTLGMLSNNNIPGLLPIRFVQMNNERQFMYNVTARVSLKQYMSGNVTKSRCIDILRGITGTALSISEYMLDYSSLIFDVDYIFVDVSTNELLMVCLPINMERHDLDMETYFRQLTSNMIFSEEENMEYPARILNILNRKGSATDKISNEKRRWSRQNTVVSNQSFSLEYFLNQLEAMRDEDITSPVGRVERVEPVERVDRPKRFSYIIDSPVAKPGLFSDSELFDFGLAGSDTGIGSEAECEDGSVGQGRGVVGLFRRIRERLSHKEQSETEDTEDFLQKLQLAPQQVEEVGFGETTFLGEEEETMGTMLLTDEEFQGQSSAVAYLLRHKTDETVDILSDTFKIGKESRYVDYCIENNPTVSRSHADIIKKDNNFYIIDNNSTNHTYLDGEVIPNCKQMILKNGSEIVLGNEAFTFYCR
jgi:hypothetical protein